MARLLALALRPAARRQPHRRRLPARQRDRRRGEREAPRAAPARHGRRQRGGVRRRHGDARAPALARRRARRDGGPQLRRIGGAGGIGRACRRRRRPSSRRFVRQLNAVYERVAGRGQDPDRRLARGRRAAGGGGRRRRSPPPAATVVVAMDNCANQLVLYGAQDAIACAAGVRSPAPARSACRCRSTAATTPPISPTSAPPSTPTTGDIKLRAPQRAALFVRLGPAFPELGRGGAQARRGAVVADACAFARRSSRCTPTACGCFVEVGPSGNLTAFVNDIPAGKAQIAIADQPAAPQRRRAAADGARRSSTRAVGRCALQSLFAGRRIAAVDLERRRADSPSVRRAARQHHADAALFGERPRGLSCGRVSTPMQRAARRSRGRHRGGRCRQRRARRRRARSRAARSPPESEHDPRADVMAEYFDVMRGFLEQQRAVVAVVAGARPIGRPPLPAPAASADLPFLDEIVEHDEQHLVARCHLSLRRQLPAQPRASGPGLRDRSRAVGAGVRAADGQPRDHGRGLQPARRQRRACR